MDGVKKDIEGKAFVNTGTQLQNVGIICDKLSYKRKLFLASKF